MILLGGSSHYPVRDGVYGGRKFCGCPACAISADVSVRKYIRLQPPSISLVMCIKIDSSGEDTSDTAPSLVCNPHANAITLCCFICQYSNIFASSHCTASGQ